MIKGRRSGCSISFLLVFPLLVDSLVDSSQNWEDYSMRSDLLLPVPCPIYYNYRSDLKESRRWWCWDQEGDHGKGCRECRYLLDALSKEGRPYGWVCPFCLSEVRVKWSRRYRAAIKNPRLPQTEVHDICGYYSEGSCEATLLNGKPCGRYSNILTLVVWED